MSKKTTLTQLLFLAGVLSLGGCATTSRQDNDFFNQPLKLQETKVNISSDEFKTGLEGDRISIKVDFDTNEDQSGIIKSEEKQKTTDYVAPNFLYWEDNDLKYTDPLEPYNRFMFMFNRKYVQKKTLNPVSNFYSLIMPDELEQAFKDANQNWDDITSIIPSLIQFKFEKAGKLSLSVLINSTICIGGLGGRCSREFGLEEQKKEGFDQVFAGLGIGSGVPVDIPVLDKKTTRQIAAMPFDFMLDPISYVATAIQIPFRTIQAINEYTEIRPIIEEFERKSLDPYIAETEAMFSYAEKQLIDKENKTTPLFSKF